MSRPGQRQLLSAAAIGLALVVLVPPAADAARSSEWAQALQFSVLALVVPALFVAGAPWTVLGLGRGAHALAEARRRHPERLRSAAVVAVALGCAAWWRTPAAVDQLHKGGWLLAAEAASLTLAGAGLWLECISSPPLAPRATRPVRIAMAAASLWTIWLLAYLLAMAHGNWYPAFRHVAGHGLSLTADQQTAAAVIWAVAAACFVPLVFWNLFAWLRSEDDPDEELHRLLREERRRASPRPQAR